MLKTIFNAVNTLREKDDLLRIHIFNINIFLCVSLPLKKFHIRTRKKTYEWVRLVQQFILGFFDCFLKSTFVKFHLFLSFLNSAQK